MTDLPHKLIKPSILKMKAYSVTAGEFPVKLDAMENPYALPEETGKELTEYLNRAHINRYPPANFAKLMSKISRIMGLPPANGIIPGNGSDELIQLIMLALAKPRAKLLTVEPGFAMYKIIASFTGLEYHPFSLNRDFSLDENRFIAKINVLQPEIIFISNPNNPTGNMFDRRTIAKIIQASPGLVVVDEAYFGFARENLYGLLDQYPDRLLILRTLSKLGAAGLRFGFLAGSHQWLQELNKIRLPYNISIMTYLAVEFLLDHYPVLVKQAEIIKSDREKMYANLQALTGIIPYKSETNFILFRVENRPASEIYNYLKTNGVLIKNLDGTHPLLTDCLRVSIGTARENVKFMKLLASALCKQKRNL